MTNVVSAKLAKGIGPGFSSQVYWFESPKGGIWVVASGEYIGDKAQKFADDYLALQGSLFQNLKISFASFVENIDPSILIGVLAFEDNLVSVTSRGELKALLIRNGQKTIIFSGRDEILTVSGKANIGDTLVFATAQAMQTIVELPYFPKDEAIFKDYSEKIIQEMGNHIPGVMLFWSKPEAPFANDSAISVGQQSFLDKFKNVRLPQKNTIKINQELDITASKKKRMTVILGVILLVALLASIFFGMKRKEYLVKVKDFDEKLSSANALLEEARSLKDLSRDKARTLLLTARATSEDLSKVNPEDTRLKALKEGIEESLGAIAGLYKSGASLYLDLGLVTNDFETKWADLSENELLLLDKAGEKLISVNMENKKTEVSGGPSELNNAFGVAAYVGRKFVLEGDGVKEISSLSTKKSLDREWGDGALLKAFAGNLYILDKSANDIWRFPGSSGTFGAKSSWIAADMSYQLDDSIDWAIDGSIWVLDTSGKLSKYIGGRLDSFTLSENGDYKSIYTDAESKYVYLLDKKAGKVKFFDKKGKFEGEYDDPQILEALSIVVSESTKKLLLIGRDKIYQIELKHL